MGERKVLNKYYDADFDPDKIPRRAKRGAKTEKYMIRMMLPMSVRCKACGEYMYKGRKFNSRREDAEGEDYLGIKIIRFFMNCTNCRAEFCIKTDPKNEDYVVESGAHRNYEPWRDREATVEAEHAQRAAEDDTDAMKKLENRTKDSKMEMDLLDTLDELRTISRRKNAANIDDVIARTRGREPAGEEANLDDADEALVQAAFRKAPAGVERRIVDLEGAVAERAGAGPPVAQMRPIKRPLVVVKPKAAAQAVEDVQPREEAGAAQVPPKASGLTSLGAYGGSDDSDDLSEGGHDAPLGTATRER